ncbi:ABC transporter substrate-binding protein [Pelistega sp. MC2]|uniref:ABC transporter substrate-binding protein n=1 Tax=Pelistega sp. MC2 TaxID=1720297 RepID=UPI0008D9E1FB|nr:ABC transporter substrate-binding protein [Pelistega sp. MC2]
MKFATKILAGAIALGSLCGTTAVYAQEQDQFIPLMTYRTGSFAPLGIAWADGKIDYLRLVNAREGGVNGVKLSFEECETGYATDRGVECYERLKNANGGASGFDSQSTGITFAVSDKAPVDKVSIETPGYGLSQSSNGTVFKWNFPLLGTYWTAADVMIQDIAKREGGIDKLKGKKIALVYHDSPYGKEPIPLLKARAEANGFELILYPVTAPGVEQKSTWLNVRQKRPDYLLLWSAGIMTPTAIREAQSTGYPREKMYGIWWAGSENDVKDLAAVAKGYNIITIHNTGEAKGKVFDDLKTYLFDKGQAASSTVGTIAYNRGMVISMLQVEAIRAAQEKFGKGKHMTSEQVRWGFENLNITEDRLKELGFENMLRPVKTTCENHMGDDWARIMQWDGAKFVATSDNWYQADKTFVDPLVKSEAEKYAAAKKIEVRDCSKEDS